jgi:hypothetical protein
MIKESVTNSFVLETNNSEAWAKQKCFAKSECIFGDFMSHVESGSPTDCREQCHSTAGCKWFTFNPRTKQCFKYSSCTEFHPTSQCPDCVSGRYDCDFKCWISNSKCLGTFVDKVFSV